MKRGSLAPAFFELQSGAQRAARQVEGTTLIAENIAPTAGSRLLSARIAAECHGTCAGNHDDSRLPGGRAAQSNFGVVGNLVAFTADQFAGVGLFVFSAAA